MDDPIDAADQELLAEAEAALSVAERAAGPLLDYGRGCPECCIGPFPITALDARRLRHGLAELEVRDPGRAAAVRRRAEEAVAVLAPELPGNPATGILSKDDAAGEAFCERFASIPCPALEVETGRCDLYAWRPLSCRTYGPPVRLGGEDVAPCHLCFDGAPEDVVRCRVAPDREGREAALLAEIERRQGAAGETLIAFALARAPQAGR